MKSIKNIFAKTFLFCLTCLTINIPLQAKKWFSLTLEQRDEVMALHKACFAGDIEIARELLNEENINTRAPYTLEITPRDRQVPASSATKFEPY